MGENLDGVNSTDHEQEGDEADRHVQSVEAGREVESRAVGVAIQHDPFTGEDGVFVNLANDEERAHCVREPEPLDDTPLGGSPTGSTRLQTLCREHAHLAGDRRENEDGRVERRERDAELFGLRGPNLGGHRSEREVNREQSGEEHHFAREPHNRSDSHGIGPVHNRLRSDCRGASHNFYYAHLSLLN